MPSRRNSYRKQRKATRKTSRKQRKQSTRKQRGAGFFNFFSKAPAPAPASATASANVPAANVVIAAAPAANVTVQVPSAAPNAPALMPSAPNAPSVMPSAPSAPAVTPPMNYKKKMNRNFPAPTSATGAPRRTWKNWLKSKGRTARNGLRNTASVVKGLTASARTAFTVGPRAMRNALSMKNVYGRGT